MWQDTSEGDSGANEGIEFFVTADGKLEMAGSNALDLEILGGVLGMIGQYGTSGRKKEVGDDSLLRVRELQQSDIRGLQ